MTTPAPRRALVLAATTACLAAGLASPASAADELPPRTPITPDRVAVGLIVETAKATPSRTEIGQIAGAVSADAADVTPIDSGLVTVPFEEPLPAAEAVAAAADLADLPGVEHVEPNYVIEAAKAPPVSTNDEGFGELHGIWDGRAFTDEWWAGGFSIRAPYLWRATRGSSSVRVAVIDTGVTRHPDLDANRVAGYDFVSAGGDPFDRDGQPGWDADATDPGDYREAGDLCFGLPTTPTSSSWHGTHVAGTVAAIDDNRRGVVGVAPNVKIQPIRVLGSCGGTTADVATAIKWAAGERIPGVPVNRTPSQVLNLSLGDTNSCDLVMQDAVSTARARGAVVIAAAGNDRQIGFGSPGNCIGTTTVVALNEIGQATSYTNVGSATRRANLAAPGGDAFVGMAGVLSTYNGGTTTPGAPTYAELNGTSMATPHVAGGAALLYSLGYTRPYVEGALTKAVRGFPQYGDGSTREPYGYAPDPDENCTSSRTADPSQWDCGVGSLDLGQVPAIIGDRVVRGTMKPGRTVSTPMRGTGVAATYQWYRNGVAIKGATRQTYRLTKADRRKRITVRAVVKKAGYLTLAGVSPARKVARK